MSSEAEPRQRRDLIALLAAWLVVLAAVAGVAAYVAVQRLGQSRPAPISAMRPATAPSMVLELPSAPTSLTLREEQAPAEALVSANGEPAAPEATPEATPETSVEATAASEAAAPQAEPAGATAEGEPAGEARPADSAAAEDGGDQALPAAPVEPADAAAEPLPGGEALETAGEPQGAAGAPVASEPRQQAALPRGDVPPWRQYAAAFDETRSGPRIGVVLSGLGLSAAATEAAIKQLPAEITLSFSPYARLLNQWIALARANGHEVMLDLPMEPVTFPEDDPGPHALLTVLDDAQNEKRLDWLLRRGSSYVGVSAVMGSRFMTSREHMLPVLESLKKRGLLFLDNHSSDDSAAMPLAERLDLPLVVNDRTLDEAQASRVAINARLSEIERLARENGFAVAMAQPYPVTIERLRDWTVDLQSRGFVLAPITALATPRPG